MKRFRHILTLLIAGFVSFSCSDEQLPSHSASSWQGNGQIQLTLTAAEEIRSGETKAVDVTVDEGTAANYHISDFVLFQFDERGNRLVDPQYYTYNGNTQTIPVVLPTGSQQYTIVALANTHDPLAPYYFADATTLDALMGKYKSVQKLEDTYQQQASSYDLLMNGWTTINKNTQSLNLILYRNVAKLTLTINNASGSGITIKTAQVKSVPTKIDYFYQLIADNKPVSITPSYPNPNAFRNFDYEVDQFKVDEGNSKALTYYLPCHLMGTSESTAETTKGNYAPDYATFVELYAEKKDGSKFARYRFYLGDNKTNDYNICPNYHYNLPLTFNGLGSHANDARVEIMDAVLTEPEANSYILNPLSTEEQQMYKIPVVDRINTFWQNEFSAGHIPTATTYTIMPGNKWVAEVLWQTSDQQLIQFCNTDGTLTDNEGRMPVTYSGQVPLRVKPCQGASGNVIVGVYRKDIPTNDDPATREYSWSWHLWVTDYNPDECRNQNWEERYVYKLSNGSGEVHRYVGDAWNNKYQNCWIMDRNLGALENSGSYNSRGLFYKYGNKNCFVTKKDTYYQYDSTNNSFIKGTILKNKTPNDFTTIDYFVRFPYIVLNSMDATFTNNKYTENIWDNPTWNTQRKKSFFDPCPYGWRLPEVDIWNTVSKNIQFNSTGAIMFCDDVKGSNNVTTICYAGDVWGGSFDGNYHNFMFMSANRAADARVRCLISTSLGSISTSASLGVGGSIRPIQYDEEADE